MGASNCPETPRQRMIGMMYLVLTALLALNVSKEILNAFSIVDETLQTSNLITEAKNNQDYLDLNRQKEILGEEKVAQEFEKAMKIKESSDEIVIYIEELKKQLIEYVDGESAVNPDGTIKLVAQLQQKDNTSKPTNFMINEHRATELRGKLEQYRNLLLSFVNEKDREAMSQTIGINVNGKFHNATGTPETWEVHYFSDVIFAACVTLLNKAIGEVRNAESGVLKYVIRSITKDDFNFSEVKAKVIPKSQIVFRGEAYEAEIIVAAYDDKQPIEAYWRSGSGEMTSTQGATLIKGNEGIAPLKIGTNAVGDFNYTGLIKMTGPDGLPKTYPFSGSYTVMAPSATVAADKMNVLYAGIENPVSANASVALERISISLSGGSQTKTGPGQYNISVPESLIGQTLTITTTANIGDKQQTMGSTVFRVKRVPNPEACLGGTTFKGGRISKAELLANPFILASMGQDFVYDLQWSVNSYQVTFIIKGIEDPPVTCTGRNFSETIKSKISSSPAGTVVYFSDIRASCVAGSRTLNSVAAILR